MVFIDEQSYHSKSVICYDMAGNIVARYSSIRKAAAAIGKNSPSGLAKILREGRKEYAGYLWQYENNQQGLSKWNIRRINSINKVM